jgi:hypothetical protein
MHALAEIQSPDSAAFAKIRETAEPVVLRGLVSNWPVAAAGMRGDLGGYLSAMATDAQVPMVRAKADEQGRLHYAATIERPNFDREPVAIAGFFAELERQSGAASPDTLAIQGLAVGQILPGFAADNPMPLLPAEVEPRLWLGTAAKVATHSDQVENLACVVAGRCSPPNK